MECLHCKGELTRQKVSYTANRNGYHLIIDDVPAWVCRQCGEHLFDEETTEAIQAMLREMDRRQEQLAHIGMAA
jgi:YgiT-type zinc finger domain-containing protein